MIMAAAAPMAVVVALMPLAFAFGNGNGVPGTYLVAIVAMLLFTAGYVRLVPHVRNAGAFYAYIAASIGRAPGLAAAYVAALSYFALSCSTVAALAFFAEQLFENVTGRNAHWSVWGFASIGLVCWLSLHRITLAAKVLGVALLAEVGIILLLDLAIVRDVGLQAFSLADFSPDEVLVPGLGVAAIYAFNSMIGIEGSAIYQEEARRRHVTVPRATYIAVLLTGLFYVFTAWCLATATGPANVSSVARSDPGSFVVNAGGRHLGQWGADAIGLLVLTSAFAASLGLFNNAARYLYALARDGVLPAALSRTHPKHRSPHVAGFVLTTALVTVIALAALAGLDPLVNVSTALTGLGSVGLMSLLAATSLIVPVFFARRGQYGFAITPAPLIGGAVIAVAVYLAFTNYSALTGVTSVAINRLPYVLLFAAAFGVVQAQWMRRNDPARYSTIGNTRLDAVDQVAVPTPAFRS
jgi:amino acid transporter